MFFLEKNSEEHNFKFADQDTKSKGKDKEKNPKNSIQVSSPKFKTDIPANFFNRLGIVGGSPISAELLYETHLSKEMIDKYGKYIVATFNPENLEIPLDNFLDRHEFTPKTRAQMVNWMLEVFHVYDCDENTIFAAVRIMDKYCWKSRSIINAKTFFAIGVVCIYIASKAYDSFRIKMKDIVHNISHDALDEILVKKYEKRILAAVDFDVMPPGPSEFIQFLLYDLYMNNKSVIKKFRLKKIIDIVENCAIWVAKMCNHFEKYSCKAPNHIAVACLLIGYEMTKDNKKLSSNEKEFFVEWLEFIFVRVGKNPEEKKSIDNLYQDIYASFVKFKTMEYKNLMKYHELYFD